MQRIGQCLEESKRGITKNFLTQLENFATKELQKEFPQIGIYIKRKKMKRIPRKIKKTTETPTPNDLKGPTITRPKTLPFLTCICLPFFSSLLITIFP